MQKHLINNKVQNFFQACQKEYDLRNKTVQQLRKSTLRLFLFWSKALHNSE